MLRTCTSLKVAVVFGLIAVLAALAFSTSAMAQEILWDNDLITDGVNARAISPPVFPDIRVVDDFVIPEGECWIIRAFHTNILEDANWQDGGVAEIYIYDDPDNAGGPDNLVVSLSNLPFSKMDTGEIFFGRANFDYWIEDLNIPLGSGRYWIGSRYPNADGAPTNWWMTSSGQPDGPDTSAWFSLNAAATWDLEGDPVWDHAFTIIGVAAAVNCFTNQAEFEAFNAAQGNVLKGTEDFEESILGPNDIVNLDDPLESGVPNSPDGFPFPDGLTGLPDLIVQSNILGGNPIVPDPQGVGGLAAASAGIFALASDVVVPGTIPNSLDLIFTNEKSAVGFDTISLLAGDSVEVRVYSPDNVLLVFITTPADPSGANFIGVSSSALIGRINIYDPNSKPEGADNIQAWEEVDPCPWDLDDNGVVGASDLLGLLASWGPCKGCPADFDENGIVGASDLLALLANWGPCP